MPQNGVSDPAATYERGLQKVLTWISLEISLLADGAYNNHAILKPLAFMGITLGCRKVAVFAIPQCPGILYLQMFAFLA